MNANEHLHVLLALHYWNYLKTLVLIWTCNANAFYKINQHINSLMNANEHLHVLLALHYWNYLKTLVLIWTCNANAFIKIDQHINSPMNANEHLHMHCIALLLPPTFDCLLGAFCFHVSAWLFHLTHALMVFNYLSQHYFIIQDLIFIAYSYWHLLITHVETHCNYLTCTAMHFILFINHFYMTCFLVLCSLCLVHMQNMLDAFFLLLSVVVVCVCVLFLLCFFAWLFVCVCDCNCVVVNVFF